jgi:hypothetical protein
MLDSLQRVLIQPTPNSTEGLAAAVPLVEHMERDIMAKPTAYEMSLNGTNSVEAAVESVMCALLLTHPISDEQMEVIRREVSKFIAELLDKNREQPASFNGSPDVACEDALGSGTQDMKHVRSYRVFHT